MARCFAILLAGWLALQAWLLVSAGSARWRLQQEVAAASSPGGRYAAILERPEAVAAIDQLLAEIEAAIERGEERLLIVAPAQFGWFVPLARHRAFPVQILDQVTGERNAGQLIQAGVELGAASVLWYRPAKGWQKIEVGVSR